jgi:sugar phosphate isomerase/epimerase
MNRRELLSAAGAAVAFIGVKPAFAETVMGKGRLGGSPTCFAVRMRSVPRAARAMAIIEHCHKLGLTGAESFLTSTDPEVVKAIRQKVEAYNMLIVLNTRLPKEESDVSSFDAAVAACKEAGAIALHAAMSQRRYEEFDSLEEFKANFAQCQRTIALAEPVLRKHKMRLAIENHKGWRASEQAAWMKRLGSEWVGVCFDFGNNISLCELPQETFELLSPYAIFCHLKDMGVEEYQDGFLLSEVPLGEGVINLKRRVDILRAKDPNMLFCLEMITRDPLKIPVFTDKYWATFSDPSTEIPGRDVAMTWGLVHRNPPKEPLPQISKLSAAAQLQAEDQYNQRCIDYARTSLNFS